MITNPTSSGRGQSNQSGSRSRIRPTSKIPGKSTDRQSQPTIRTTITSQPIGDWTDFTMLTMCGRDCAGLIRFVASKCEESGVSIRSSFTTRLEDEYSGTFFIIYGPAERIQEFNSHIGDWKTSEIDGKEIQPASLYEIRIRGQDRVGMLRSISDLLYEHDINIFTMGIETIEEVGPGIEDDLEDSCFEPTFIGDITGRTAFINLHAEIPQERISFLKDMESRMRDDCRQKGIPEWDIRIREIPSSGIPGSIPPATPGCN